MAKRVKRTRNLETETEAQFFAKLRSALRRHYMYWKPAKAALDAARRKYRGENKRQKWEYHCAKCNNWLPRNHVEIDHIIPCGTLRSFDDLPGFVSRLACEDISGYQVLCKTCHKAKTGVK